MAVLPTSALADFLSRALPWPAPGAPGVVNLHWRTWKGHGITGGKPFTSLDDAVSFINWAKGDGSGHIRELYYCTSLQKDVGPLRHEKPTALRNRDNTLCSKVLFTDMDKGYETPGHALLALIEFCKSTHSPMPTAVVGSGNGLHAYWFSQLALPPEEWSRYAHALDDLLTRHGVTHDPVTTDITRILRPPGTFNNKGHERGLPPKPVELKLLAPTDIDFSTWEVLNAAKPTVSHVAPRASMAPEELFVDPAEASVPPSKLITDSLKPEDWIGGTLDFGPILQCPMFKHTLETHGDGVGQPLWNQQALACTFINGGEALFHELSNGDPRYTFDQTAEMFARKAQERIKHRWGYPLCTTFEREGSAQCPSCPLKGAIKSPLSLKAPKQQPEAPPLQEHTGPLPPGLTLPSGYAYSETRPGAIDCFVMTEKKPVQRPMILSVLTDFTCTKNRSGEFELSFKTTTDKDQFAEVTLKNEALASPTEICKIFTKAGVDYLPSRSGKICDLMNTFMGRLKELERATSGVPYGWITSNKEGEKAELTGFAYGGHVFNADGTVSRAATGDRVTSRTFMPRGDELSWFTALDVLLQQKRIPLQTVALCGFASPLMKLTGFHGVSVMVYGDSGGNKSTASDLACSIWGSAKGVKEVPSTSSMSMQGKMAETRHLLNCWDDIQKPQYERIAKLLMEITQGKGGGKMTSTHDQKDMGEWDSILLTTSNDSLGSFVVKANKNDAAALFRFFDFRVEKVADNTPGRASPLNIEPIYTALDDNFGWIGLRYARMLGHKLPEIKQVLKEAQADIEAHIGRIPDNERYWATAATCLLASSIIANAIIMEGRRELKLPPGPLFNTDGVRKHVLETYREMRLRVSESAVISSSEDYVRQHLSDFLNKHNKNAVWTDNANLLYPDGAALRHIDRIIVRWDVASKTLVLSRPAFRDYLVENDVGADSVVAGLKRFYGATPNKRRIAAGIVGATSVQEHLLVIPVPDDSWLSETLFEHQE